jgi:hypothetical protein
LSKEGKVKTMENKNVTELEKEKKMNDAALIYTSGVTLASTCIMIADVSIKASGISPGLPSGGVFFLGVLMLMGAGFSAVSYCARQSTLLRIKEAQTRVVPLEGTTKEEVPVTA